MNKKIKRSCKLLVTALALSFPVVALSQVFTLEDAEVPVGATQATLEWNFDDEGAGLTGIGIFFDYDTGRLTPLLDPPAGMPPTQSVTGCRNAATLALPVAFCEPTIAPPPHLSLGLSALFNPMPSLQPGGSITFTIDPPIADGETLPVQAIVNNAAVTPGGSALTANSGEIRAVSAPPAVAAIDPGSWAPTVSVGSTSPTQTFTVSNDAAPGQTPPAANLDIQDIEITGAGAAVFTDTGTGSCQANTTSLAPGDECTVVLSLDTGTVGNFAASLDIGTSAGPLDAGLNADVLASDAILDIDPGAADFGTLDINAPAVSETFTVTNTGTNDTATGVSVGTLAAPFAISANNCGATLGPQASCQITVTFDPTSDGTFNAVLSVTSDASDVSAPLEGVGGSSPNIVINPPFGNVNFGAVLIGTSSTLNGNVQNTGSADVTVEIELVDSNTPAIFSTSLPLGTPVDLVAGAAAIDFTVTCSIPADATDGTTFTAEIQVSVGGDPATDATTHFLSCIVQEFEPVPIPTMQNWGLILLALMMLLVGGITIRFFRA